MGKQSSRIYFQGKDHKDIYFKGQYHTFMYKGKQLMWEKIFDNCYIFILSKHLIVVYPKIKECRVFNIPVSTKYTGTYLFSKNNEQYVIYEALAKAYRPYFSDVFDNKKISYFGNIESSPIGIENNFFVVKTENEKTIINIININNNEIIENTIAEFYSSSDNKFGFLLNTVGFSKYNNKKTFFYNYDKYLDVSKIYTVTKNTVEELNGKFQPNRGYQLEDGEDLYYINNAYHWRDSSKSHGFHCYKVSGKKIILLKTVLYTPPTIATSGASSSLRGVIKRNNIYYIYFDYSYTLKEKSEKYSYIYYTSDFLEFQRYDIPSLVKIPILNYKKLNNKIYKYIGMTGDTYSASYEEDCFPYNSLRSRDPVESMGNYADAGYAYFKNKKISEPIGLLIKNMEVPSAIKTYFLIYLKDPLIKESDENFAFIYHINY